MSPPISSTVKERVIQLHLEGKGRNEIAQILNSSHIRISQGSITNILRRKPGNSAPSQHPETRPQEVTPSPPSPDDNKGPGQSQVPLRIENAKGQEHVPGCAKGPEGPDEVNLVNPVCQDSEKETTPAEVQETQVQSSEVQEESFMDLEWSRIFGEIEEAKKQRREELLLIDRRSALLEEQKRLVDYEWRSIEQARYELDRREARLLEVEPLIPVARQLQDLRTSFLSGSKLLTRWAK